MLAQYRKHVELRASIEQLKRRMPLTNQVQLFDSEVIGHRSSPGSSRDLAFSLGSPSMGCRVFANVRFKPTALQPLQRMAVARDQAPANQSTQVGIELMIEWRRANAPSIQQNL